MAENVHKNSFLKLLKSFYADVKNQHTDDDDDESEEITIYGDLDEELVDCHFDREKRDTG